MKITLVIVRVLLGVLYAASALAWFFNLMPQNEMSGDTGTFITGLVVSGYFFPLLKWTELLCGISLISGKFAPLANVIIFPVTVHIFLFHAFLAPDGMIIPAAMVLMNLFLAYGWREKYSPMLQF